MEEFWIACVRRGGEGQEWRQGNSIGRMKVGSSRELLGVPCHLILAIMGGGRLLLPLEAPSVQLPALGSPFTALKPLLARIQEVEAERKATRRLGFCHLGFSKPQLGEDG